jgi:F0F1-type ATP synthase assembly protein I
MAPAVRPPPSRILFTLAFVFLNVSFLPLFLTYIATLLVFWVALPLTVHTSVNRHE